MKDDKDLEEKKDDEEDYYEVKVSINKKKITIGFIIVGCIIVVALVILIVSTLLGKKSSQEEPKDNPSSGGSTPEQQEETDPDLIPDTRERIPRTGSPMYIYVYNGELVEDSYCNDECRDKSSGYASMEIEDVNAKVLDISPTNKYEGKFPDYVLFKDGDKIKYFDLKEHRSYVSGVNSSYVKYTIIENNDKIEAVTFKKKGEIGLFSLSTRKPMYVNKYDLFEPLTKGLVKGIIKDKTDILSLSEEKVLENINIELLEKFERIEKFNVIIDTVNSEELYTVYDNNYNMIVEKVNKNLTYFEDDTIYYIKDEKVFGYNNKGSKLYESTLKHDSIVMVTKNFYVSINGDNFELRNLKDEKVVLKGDVEGYKLDYYHSGYKDKSEFTTSTGDGLYLDFISESNGTISIVEYYYNVKTGESKKDTIKK
jgi:hypothetical protein